MYHTVPLTPVWGLRMLILRALGAMEGAERGVLCWGVHGVLVPGSGVSEPTCVQGGSGTLCRHPAHAAPPSTGAAATLTSSRWLLSG